MPNLNFLPDDPNVMKIRHFEIQGKSLYVLKPLYVMVHEWLVDKGYECPDYNNDKFEHLYFQKVLADGALEHWIWWRAERIPEHGSSYFKYFVKFDIQTIYMQSTDIVVDGEKTKVNNGETVFKFGFYLMMDQDRRFRDHKYLKLVHNWFKNKIYKRQIDWHEEFLTQEAYELHSRIKQFLKIKTAEEIPKHFYPERGL